VTLPASGIAITGDTTDVMPPSRSLPPALPAASAPVTRSKLPLAASPSCLAPPASVGSGLARSQRPAFAVSLRTGLIRQPRSRSKSSLNTTWVSATRTTTVSLTSRPPSDTSSWNV